MRARSLSLIHVLALLAPVFLAALAQAEELTIGSPAPALQIEHWFHDHEPVTSFEKGRVYVVEFWATWCGPCVASMPHLAEIQKRHAGEVTVIGVSDEKPETVDEFLDRERDGVTFREVTSGYWLTTDPDASVKRDYLQAAGEAGIPTAFVIGKTGEIEWIGHPGRMDEPLAKILAGEWDRDSYAIERIEEKKVRAQTAQIKRLMQKNKYDEALARFDALMAEVKTERLREGLAQGRKRVETEAAAFAERSQKEAEHVARMAKAHAETVAGLLAFARHLEAREVGEAVATLDRLIASTENKEAKRLLKEAREALEAE